MKNLKKTSQRIKKAIASNEQIILYGDADLDGITSVLMLEETISFLGGRKIKVYFPDREKEGYGLNESALEYLKKNAPNALLIVLDCSIANFKEADLAYKLGFELIIVDHHQPLDKLPKASLIVCPKQPGDKYPFKEMANAGLVFKLCQEILKKDFVVKEKSFLELTAFATIADMMPQKEDNIYFIKQGRQSLKNSNRIAIKVLRKIKDLKDLSEEEFIQKAISFINISPIESHITKTYHLLKCSNEKKALSLAKDLVKESKKRKIEINKIVLEVEKRIAKNPKQIIVFEGKSSWPITLLGTVSSKICQKYKKPVFLIKIKKLESRGAVRMSKGHNAVEAMKSCSHLLLTFGGHPAAAGFYLKTKNLEKYKNCLIDYFNKI